MTSGRTYTRRLDKVLNDLDDEFKSICSASSFTRKLEQLKSSARSARPSVMKELYVMLDNIGIEYEKGKDYAYYEQLVNYAYILDTEEIEERMLHSLNKKYQGYPTPEEYMLRIVNTLASPSDKWQNDTLRLRILKQFIKYGNYLHDADFGGRLTIRKYVREKINRSVSDDDVIAVLDDGIFSCLNDASRDERRPEGSFGIIKLSDDLASGKFRTGGATKRGLYLFAMVYDMTYTIDSTDMICDEKTDIEKNLFTDYYTNNLMRYLSDSYNEEAFKFESDPSGQGINYKNFSEMIYLYFISRREYTPQEKIKRSHEMIKALVNSGNESHNPESGHGSRTSHYREIFTEDILSLNENEFMRFIRENYNCNTSGKFSSIQIESEQSTAFSEYSRILHELREFLRKRDEIPESEDPLDDCRYGLWITDINALRDGTRIIEGIDDEFINVLEAAHSFLASGSSLRITNPSLITRTSLVTAWYYYFNAIHEHDSKGIWNSFGSLFFRFKAGIDIILQKSGYQLFSGKNIFDLLIAFSSYAFLNL